MGKVDPTPIAVSGEKDWPKIVLFGWLLCMLALFGVFLGLKLQSSVLPKTEPRSDRTSQSSNLQQPITDPSLSRQFTMQSARNVAAGGLCSLLSPAAVAQAIGPEHDLIPGVVNRSDGSLQVSCELQSFDAALHRGNSFALTVTESPMDAVWTRDAADWRHYQEWSQKYNATLAPGFRGYPGVLISLGEARQVYLCGSLTVEYHTYREEPKSTSGRDVVVDEQAFFRELVSSACGTTEKPTDAVVKFPQRVYEINKTLGGVKPSSIKGLATKPGP